MTDKFIPKEDHRLPSRELAYNYTVAMHFGQQLELNLRAILYAADYHGWGNDIALTPDQKRRFKETDDFIDKATCGAIITALRNVGVITEPLFFKIFERACSHRNKLAHSFLSEQDFDHMTKEQTEKLIIKVQEMAADLYKAMRFSRGFRSLAEAEADKSHASLQEFFDEYLGKGYDNPNRKYGTRIPKKKRKPRTGPA
jgi:hypothetical protein